MKKIIPILLILILASFLRFFALDKIPNGFSADEASNGYDAYSFLLTGKDRHGDAWPITLKAFSDRVDHRSSIYTYSSIPFIALFGLNEFSTRFAAALFGILSILMLYFLMKEMFDRKIAIIAAFLLTISPWHLFMSRVAFEASLVPFYFITALYFLYKGTIKNKNYLFLASLFAGLLMYNYPVTRLFLPLFLLIYFFIFRKIICKNKLKFVLALGLFILIILPLVIYTLNNYLEVQGRFNQISIFNQHQPLLIFLKNYLNYFLPQNLFIRGGIVEVGHESIGFGVVYLFLLPFIIFSIWFLLKNRKKSDWLLLSWLVLSPIPACLTISGTPHILRSVIAIPIFEIIAAIGIYAFMFEKEKFPKIEKLMRRKVYLFIFILFFLINISLFFHYYYLSFPKNPFSFFQYGFKEAIQYIDRNNDQYQKVFITENANQPYIFVLFYLKYDPLKFQNQTVNSIYQTNNWQRVISFDKYEFAEVKIIDKSRNYIYILRGNELPDENYDQLIYYPDKKNIAFKIIK